MRIDDSILRLEMELSEKRMEWVKADDEKKIEIEADAEILKRRIKALQYAKGLKI